jgi:hypothetical protein
LPNGAGARDVLSGQRLVVGAQLEVPPRSVTLLQLEATP